MLFRSYPFGVVLLMQRICQHFISPVRDDMLVEITAKRA